jgi:glucose-1-phosphate thymidylyltransferase
MRGILLAGGAGSRLDPITRVASKQLQPVYDKPMIYYPLSTLLESGVRDILLISTPHDTPRFEDLLGDGSQWGVSISYGIQETPGGIAQSLLIGRDFIGDEPVALILGDNIFYGNLGLMEITSSFAEGALIFGYPVVDPSRYGVVEIGPDGRALSLEEKPARPRTNLAVPGFYVYDRDVVAIAEKLRPSARGELEITDVNREYLARGDLQVIRLGRGFAWLDSGTHDSLLDAANFIATVEHRQGLKIACLEEVALRLGYVDEAHIERLMSTMPDSTYREYVERVLTDPSYVR